MSSGKPESLVQRRCRELAGRLAAGIPVHTLADEEDARDKHGFNYDEEDDE